MVSRDLRDLNSPESRARREEAKRKGEFEESVQSVLHNRKVIREADKRDGEDRLVDELAVKKRRSLDAERIVSAEDWREPDPGYSLAELQDNPPMPVTHVIDNLIPEGVSQLNAQFKAGKTTLGIDLAACYVSCQEFLDYFPVADDGNIWYWNMEVDESQMFEWVDQRMPSGKRYSDSSGKLFIANLRGQPMNFLWEPVVEWTIDYLKKFDIHFWIIDPLGRMLDSENEVSEYNKWFRAIEFIMSEANVRALLLLHHAGHTAPGMGDSLPRARGASSMQGNTDSNLSYRHGGDLGEQPPDSTRYLSAYGRGVDLPELTLDFNKKDRRLRVTSDRPGNRSASRIERDISVIVDAVTMAGDWKVDSTELKAYIGGNGGYKSKVIATAIRDGKLVSKTYGRKVIYAIPGANNSVNGSGNGGKQRISNRSSKG